MKWTSECQGFREDYSVDDGSYLFEKWREERTQLLVIGHTNPKQNRCGTTYNQKEKKKRKESQTI